MKNNIAIILIAGTLAAPALTQGQNDQRQQGRGHGAPNSLSNQQGGNSGSANRGTLRRPYNNENGGDSGQTGQGQGSQQGGQSGRTSRGSGMSRTEPGSQGGQGNGQQGNGNNGQTGGQGGRGNGQQGNGNNGQTGGQGGRGNGQQGNGNNGQQTGSGQRERGSLQERLNLTEEQLSKLRAAYKVWKEYAKSVRLNQELTQEEKQVKLKAGFEEYDAKVKEILTEEQYAKLVEIRRNASRPNQNNGNTGNGGNEQNGHSRAEHRRELRQILNLTEEQLTKLRRIHQYATNKIRAILTNEELSREEKSAQIKEVKKQAHNRRMQVLTEEQKEKLRQWRAEHRDEHQQQSGNNGQQTGSGQQGRGNNGQQTSQSDQVILYTIPNCGYCTKAAKLLQDNGIDFVKKNIASDHAARAELGRKTREAGIQWRGGVPVTDARGDIIVGYNRTALNRIQ
jgi:glutaredoxin